MALALRAVRRRLASVVLRESLIDSEYFMDERLCFAAPRALCKASSWPYVSGIALKLRCTGRVLGWGNFWDHRRVSRCAGPISLSRSAHRQQS